MKWTDKIELIENILSIIVELITICGLVYAYSKGFFHKVDNWFNQETVKVERVISSN